MPKKLPVFEKAQNKARGAEGLGGGQAFIPWRFFRAWQ